MKSVLREMEEQQKKKKRRGPRYQTQVLLSRLKVTSVRSSDTAEEKQRSRSLERKTDRPDSGFVEGLNVNFDCGRRFSERTDLVSLRSAASCVSEMVDGLQEEEDVSVKYRRQAEHKLKEMWMTEQSFIEKNLREIVEGYYNYMESSKEEKLTPKMPADLAGGKDRMIFANVRDIYDYHKRVMLPEIEKAMENPFALFKLFQTRKDTLKHKYGKYCLNRPKSEYIISQFENYFSTIRLKQGFHQRLCDQMMTPVQRITRYPLLMKDIEKYYARAQMIEEQESVYKALEIAEEIATYANDMMIVGRIDGFEGDVTRQGLLRLRRKVICYKRQHALKRPKLKSCQIFVFQESVIVCEDLNQGMDCLYPRLQFWTYYQVNKMTVREIASKGSISFELQRHPDRIHMFRKDLERDEAHAIVVECESMNARDEILKVINDQIRALKNFALELGRPQMN